MESSKESFLNSSLFAQDSRIGGIGGLMESSANLIFFHHSQILELVESYLISSRFTLGSRIGVIGGLVDSFEES